MSSRPFLYKLKQHEAKKALLVLRHFLSHKTCAVASMFLISASLLFASADAYNFPPDPPPYIVNKNIHIVISSISPTKTIFMNVTKYTPQHFLKNITIEFYEPIMFASFIISFLSDKPPNLSAPDNVCVLQYYYIRTFVELEDKVVNVTMNFAIDRTIIQNKDVKEESLTVYWSHAEKFQKCRIKKTVNDDFFIYLSASGEKLGYFAVAGTTIFLQKIVTITVTVIIVATVIIYLCRKFQLKHVLKNLRRNLFGG